jgi:amino acid permease
MHQPTEFPAIEAAGDIEKNAHDAHDDKDALAPQLNVGGHGSTQRRLRDYQVTMIGFCSGIGTGLFIGTGAAYAKAGPAGLLLAYAIVGAVLWCVMQSIAELATLVCLSEANLPLDGARQGQGFLCSHSVILQERQPDGAGANMHLRRIQGQILM